ncbi:MAG: hypothetical protein WBW62_05065 [Solirubrobacterales bacterium]
MTRRQLNGLLLVGMMAVVIVGATGFVIGSAASTSSSEAEKAREQSYDLAYERAQSNVQSITTERGNKAGKVRGRKAGVKSGAGEGADLGKGFISLQNDQAEVEYAIAAKNAAEAEAAERSANCGVLVRAPESCPTDSEIEAYRAAIVAARQAAAEQAEEQAKKNDPQPGEAEG